MRPETPAAAPLVLVVVQIAPDADPAPALATLAATRRVLVRPPSMADEPVPPGIELVIEPAHDRALLATRLRRAPDELVVVLTDDERASPELAASLTAAAASFDATTARIDATAARDDTTRAYRAERQVRFLGRLLRTDPVTFAWRGDVLRAAAPTRLAGTLDAVSPSVTATIDRLEALAKRPGTAVPVGPADFVGHPLAAVVRRLWRRRQGGVPGLILSIVETYGEVLAAAQAWERHGIAARRAERQSGVPPGFHIWRTPMGSLTLRDGTPPILREALLDATPAVVAGMPLAGGRGAVWAVALGEHDRGVLRWYRRGGAIRHLIFDRYFGWNPRPIRELALTEEAIRRGVAAPQVLAARVDRLPWGWYRGAIVTREVTGGRTFADELRHRPVGADRTRLVDAVGHAIRDLHDRGIHHRDLNANNILVSTAAHHEQKEQVHFIDFDRAVMHAVLGARTRERELRRLERSLVKLAGAGMPLHADDARTLRAAYGTPREPR